jgi:hypothetical protein
MSTLPEFFKQTCDKPYDRHDYKVIFDDGNQVTLDNYQDVQVLWFQRGGNFLTCVEVLDKKNKKSKKGF